MDRCKIALERIPIILSNDKDYPSDVLKLGAIYSYLCWAATYEFGYDTNGDDVIVVKPKGDIVRYLENERISS